MVKIDTPFQTKTAKKTIPFGAAHTYIREYLYEGLYKGVPPGHICLRLSKYYLQFAGFVFIVSVTA